MPRKSDPANHQLSQSQSSRSEKGGIEGWFRVLGRVKNVESSFKELEEASKSPDWERWDRLKLSAYHGRKLVKRNFQPTHPGGERFMLHDLNSLGFNTETKLFVLVQTFKRLF